MGAVDGGLAEAGNEAAAIALDVMAGEGAVASLVELSRCAGRLKGHSEDGACRTRLGWILTRTSRHLSDPFITPDVDEGASTTDGQCED